MRTIFRKELKDVLRWTPLGLIVIGLLCWREIPRDIYDCNNLSSSLSYSVAIGSSLFALALGLLQSLFDQRTDARAYLLHRPIAIDDIFKAKLTAGFVAHLLAWSIPLIVVGVYLEAIGPERLPVTGMSVIWTTICCLVSFLFHPAGMWVACREARWVGTKCLPLALPAVACLLAIMIFDALPPEWALFILILFILFLAWIILADARHAFTHQTFLPATASNEAWSWSNTIGLSVSSIMTVVAVIGIAIGLLMWDQAGLDLKARRLAVSSDGQLWEIEETWKAPRYPDDEPVRRIGRQLTGVGSPQFTFIDLDESWQEQPIVNLEDTYSRTSLATLSGYRWRMSSASGNHGGTVILFERNGRLFVYGGYSGWLGTVTPRGVFAPNETPQGAFSAVHELYYYRGSSIPLLAIGGHRLFGDENGIYQLDFDARKIRKLSDVPTETMAITLPSDDYPHAMLWARSEETAYRFNIDPMTESQSLPSVDSVLENANYPYPLTNVNITPAGQWPLNWIDNPEQTSLSVASISDGRGVVFISDDSSPTWSYRFEQADGKLVDAGELPDIDQRTTDLTAQAFLVPPGLMTGAAIVMSTAFPDDYRTLGTSNVSWLLVALHAILGGSGVFLLARRRVFSRKGQLVWLVVGLMTGISAWLAVFAACPRPVLETCPACGQRRRVDIDRCEHCGDAWESPDREGIEMIGARDGVAGTLVKVSM